MDSLVEDTETLFTDVFSHLAAVESQPGSVLLDEDLLKRAERNLAASTPRDLLWRLLRTGETLLQTIQQEPRPLTRLLEQTVHFIPFDELKATISPEKLEQGLASPSTSVQLLCLAYLRKAADSPSGASFVAASSSLVQCLFTLWLSSENTEVAERSLEVIEALLTVDSQNTLTVEASGDSLGETAGQGLLWRRVFHDPEVYEIFFVWTSLVKSKRDTKTKKGTQLVTISQARLFDFITRLAPFNWQAMTTSTIPIVETEYLRRNAENQPYGGILLYAASHMIDSNDILMKVLRQDFFLKLLASAEEGNSRNISPRLLEAIQQGAGVGSAKDVEDDGMHL
ncbi:hypothetical protein A1O3_03369 [Capronia epimyces CBS 606.96]|uniref:Uncharacterized protein n=1 Tax=Capronia epimyces CBS 606.96 TaxID=1182542 RepID=W9Y1R0_9EURO|nr:uncharacterized protein A1O3_03369 [Capronia epimyces CBS 606.96]EXJ86418.1 hypothetical protein A1O3_03369 [Capronia epimyces CBS 606.96]